jgi:hypothetical protein
MVPDASHCQRKYLERVRAMFVTPPQAQARVPEVFWVEVVLGTTRIIHRADTPPGLACLWFEKWERRITL